MYKLEFTPRARKQFSKLDKHFQNRIGFVLERIKVRPHHFVKRLRQSQYYRLRVGEYRIILDIKENKLIIIVVEVGHRKNIYKK